MLDSAMVPIYVLLIKAERRTLEQVPERLREAVAAALAAPSAADNAKVAE